VGPGHVGGHSGHGFHRDLGVPVFRGRRAPGESRGRTPELVSDGATRMRRALCAAVRAHLKKTTWVVAHGTCAERALCALLPASRLVARDAHGTCATTLVPALAVALRSQAR